MKPRICVCCGERINHDEGAVAAEYDHLCFSCANFLEEFAPEEWAGQSRTLRQTAEPRQLTKAGRD